MRFVLWNKLECCRKILCETKQMIIDPVLWNEKALKEYEDISICFFMKSDGVVIRCCAAVGFSCSIQARYKHILFYQRDTRSRVFRILVMVWCDLLQNICLCWGCFSSFINIEEPSCCWLRIAVGIFSNHNFRNLQPDLEFSLESLILAQNERWQRGLGMQVERDPGL